MENRFDIYEMPAGHGERFEAKLDAALARRRRSRLIVRLTAAAACLALVFWAGTSSRTSVWRARTPEGVYSAYMQQVGELYQLLASNTDADGGDIDWESFLDELTGETIPLIDQLPDELPDREKRVILKNYYGGILDEAGQIRKEIKRQNKLSL